MEKYVSNGNIVKDGDCTKVNIRERGMEKIMKVVVVAGCDVIREGIMAVVGKQEFISLQHAFHKLSDAVTLMTESPADAVIIGIDSDEELESLKSIKKTAEDTKFIIIDFKENSNLFVQALKLGVQGYILGKSNEQEIIYAINQVIRGKKYYESSCIDCLIEEKKVCHGKVELLTTREREVLQEMAKGLTNRKICEKFLISEHTVKKHISHIFEKLKVKDRAEAAMFVNKREL